MTAVIGMYMSSHPERIHNLKKKKKAGIVLTMNFRHIFKNINIIFLLVDSCGGPEKGRG